MISRTALLFAALWMTVSPPLVAQSITEDAEGCKDSKLLTRMSGCFIQSCERKDFDEIAIRTGPHKEQKDSVVTLEGAVEILTYECSGKVSPLQLVRNSTASMQKASYQPVFTGKDENDFQTITARKGNQWLQVIASPGGDNNSVTFYTLKTVAVTAMKQEMEATAEAISNELQASGRIALYGIHFATNSATITPDSDKDLGQVVLLLTNQPDLKLTVEGHTDNVGGAPANQTLSRQRAEAVVAWLVNHKVDRSRLLAVGFGDTKPVADNATEDGKAKNRRVELVKR